MMNDFNSQVYEAEQDGLRAYLAKVFGHMAAALGITTVVAFLGYRSLITGGFFYTAFTSFPMLSWILLIAQFGVVISLSRGITRYSNTTVRALMYGYAALTGVTFSFLPLSFGVYTVFQAFLFAAVLFVCMALIGHFTKVDLSRFSGLFMGGLIALLVVSLISIFVPALRDGLAIGYIGLLLFLGITAWDMQSIRAFYTQAASGELSENLAVYGAFELYLDFINIFLYVLRILGARSSRD